MRKFTVKVIWVINWLFIIATLIAYLGGYYSPAKLWFPSFFALAYPVWLIVLFLFTLFWMFLKKWYFLFPLITILLGWNTMTRYFSFNIIPPSPKENGIRIISYNVKNFDLYNWTHNREKRDQIIELIEGQAPDILCLQEFYTEDHTDFENVNSIKAKLQLPYSHQYYTLNQKQGNHFGEIIFSAYPIVHTGVIIFKNKLNNVGIFADLLIDDDTFRVFNVHLQSIYLDEADEAVVEKVIKNQDKQMKTSKRVINKLKTAFIARAPQAEKVRDAIKKSPYPVIVCGDFNDTPAGYAYHTISKGLYDSFKKGSFGFGATFSGKIPWLRIDYVLFGNDIRTLSHQRVKSNLSDHFPVVVQFEFEK
jgi:endonuclease/exonuclease/phosphatase family metal-dependent hydrolase